jgi:Uncharacterized alpha/beta hydrolase domain (DUF2235)
MPKNIILLSDGTNSSNIKNRGTNVYKFYEAIDFNSDKTKQVAFYDDGVGTQEFKPLKLLGGAFGWGLARNVRHLYKELVQSYKPGDKIYLFGFSRGAFTVRTLAGFICNIGILDNKVYWDDDLLDKAVFQCYQAYRSRQLAVLEKLFYKPHEKQFEFIEAKPTIEFIGVWDTVDAVGLPVDEMTWFWNKYIFRFKFPNQILNPHVKKAYHALAIDEERLAFHPLLWNIDKPIDKERIEQVWFPGSHGDVGGGRPQQGLSLVALEWMMQKAQAAGLKFTEFDLNFVKDRRYIFDKAHESRSGLGVFYRYQPRNITKYCDENSVEIPKIHECAFQRIAQGIFGYAPINIPNTFEVVDHQGKHKKSDAIAKLVGNEIGKMSPPSLMGQGASSIAQRKILYLVFIAFSLITLYWLFKEDLADAGILGALKVLLSPDGLLDKLYSLFWHHKIFVLVGAGIYGASYFVRQRMESIFAGFWSKLRADLDKLVR